MDTADVLDLAADEMWLHGRCQSQVMDASGRMCPLGALGLASGIAVEKENDSFVYDALADTPQVVALAAHLRNCGAGIWRKDDIGVIWRWNDETDDDELVIDTIRRCAKDLRNGS